MAGTLADKDGIAAVAGTARPEAKRTESAGMRHVCRLKGNIGAVDIRLTGQVQAIDDIQRQVVFPIPLLGIFGQVSE